MWAFTSTVQQFKPSVFEMHDEEHAINIIMIIISSTHIILLPIIFVAMVTERLSVLIDIEYFVHDDSRA